jgi:hypothetical protein
MHVLLRRLLPHPHWRFWASKHAHKRGLLLLLLLLSCLLPPPPSTLLRRRHRITVFVEPTVFQQLLASGRAVPWPHNQAAAAASAAGGAAGAAAAETATDSGECLCAVLEDCETQQVRSAAPVAPTPMLVPAASWPAPPGSSNSDGAAARAVPSALTRAPAPSLVRTWRSEEAAAATSAAAGMPGAAAAAAAALIPESVAQQLDLAVVLGGDGTVLWTCHIFGNRCAAACHGIDSTVTMRASSVIIICCRLCLCDCTLAVSRALLAFRSPGCSMCSSFCPHPF